MNEELDYIKKTNDGYILNLKVVPNAKKSEIIGQYENYLKIKITAQPIEGKANEAIIKFLTKYLDIPKSKIEIISGEKAKIKQVKLYLDNLDLTLFNR